MKTLLPLICVALVLTACSSTRSGSADYSNADRGSSSTPPEPNESAGTQVVTPEPGPIPTKNEPEGSVLNHNSADQPMYSR